MSSEKPVKFEFRRCRGSGQSFGSEYVPEFDLIKVTAALEAGWDPNTTWTEDELVAQTPRSGCVIFGAQRPWSHYKTPLHRAVWYDQLKIAQRLLEYGADINQLNASGRTVLHEQVDEGVNRGDGTWTKAAATWIVEHGADLNKKSETRTVAVTEDSSPPYEYTNAGGLTPLKMAVCNGHAHQIQGLGGGGWR